jgi:hypothetical protein
MSPVKIDTLNGCPHIILPPLPVFLVAGHPRGVHALLGF